MSNAILDHRVTKTEDGKLQFIIFTEAGEVTTSSIYDYVLNGGYKVLTNKVIAEWGLKGYTNVCVTDVGWALNAPERVSWITLNTEEGKETYISTDKELEEFFNSYQCKYQQHEPQLLTPVRVSRPSRPNKR